MDKVREMQAILNDLVVQLTLVDSLREAAQSFPRPFDEFLINVYRSSLNASDQYNDKWSEYAKGLNIALSALSSDVRSAVVAELKQGTFGRENFLGLCRHSGMTMVLRMSRIQRDKCRIAEVTAKANPRPTARDGEMHRIYGGAKRKVADPYESINTSKGRSVNMNV